MYSVLMSPFSICRYPPTLSFLCESHAQRLIDSVPQGPTSICRPLPFSYSSFLLGQPLIDERFLPLDLLCLWPLIVFHSSSCSLQSQASGIVKCHGPFKGGVTMNILLCIPSNNKPNE